MKWSVQRAEGFARFAHAGQVDKAGEDYVETHVGDVAARVKAAGGSDEAVMVAWLHDAVEDYPDGPSAAWDILASLPAPIAAAVNAITHSPNEPRAAYYERVKANELARFVKVHGDIPSNSNPARQAKLDLATKARLQAKYAEAMAVLAA